MEQNNDNSQISVITPEELNERLHEEADKRGETLNSYIVWLLENRPKKEKSE